MLIHAKYYKRVSLLMMKKYLLMLVISVVFLVGLVLIMFRTSEESQITRIDFTRLDTSRLKPNLIPAQNVVFYDEREWKDFWRKYGSGAPPQIDFGRYVVAGVFLGVKPNPGFGVEIKSIEQKNNHFQIEYIEYLPSPLKGYVQVVVYPYDMVYFGKVTGEIDFVGSKIERK